MTATEILKYDFANNHPKGTDQQVLINIIDYEIKSGATIVREGNTLFIFKKINPTTIEAHSFNADPADKFVKNVRAFLGFCKKMGFKQVRTDFDDPKMGRLLASFRPEYNVKTKRTEVGYSATVEV